MMSSFPSEFEEIMRRVIPQAFADFEALMDEIGRIASGTDDLKFLRSHIVIPIEQLHVSGREGDKSKVQPESKRAYHTQERGPPYGIHY